MKTEDEVMAVLEKASNDIEKILKENNLTVVELSNGDLWLDHTDTHPSGDFRVRQISVKNGE